VVHSNESFFRVLRFTLSLIAAILILVISNQEMTISSYVYVALLSIFIVFMAIVRLVIQIDTNEKKYRQGFKLFGMCTGSWVKVNDISYISIFPTLGTKDRAIPMAGVAVLSDVQMKELRINLVVNNRERIMLQSDMNEKAARKASLELAELLNIGVYDCTGSENVWLRE